MKLINKILMVYKNKKLKLTNEILISSSSLIGIIFFTLEKESNIYTGIRNLLFSSLSIFIALSLTILIRKNLKHENSRLSVKYEPIYFFTIFLLSLIPNIIALITLGDF